MGVADIAFLDGQLYAVTAGGGCSHGNPSIPNLVARVDTRTGNWTMIADLSTFLQITQRCTPTPADFEPDGTFYSLICLSGSFLIPSSPTTARSSPSRHTGDVNEVTDISEAEAHIVPTSIAAQGRAISTSAISRLFPITCGRLEDTDTVPRDQERWDSIPRLRTSARVWQKLRVAGSRAGFTDCRGSRPFGPGWAAV